MSDTREHVHELIDRLPPTQLTALAGLLEAMLDPVSHAIANAPADDEPVTGEDLRRLREGQAPGLRNAAARAFPWKTFWPSAGSRPKIFLSKQKTASNAALQDRMAR